MWFTYGCTSLSCGNFDKAAKAFRRCVNLNNDVGRRYSSYSFLVRCFSHFSCSYKDFCPDSQIFVWIRFILIAIKSNSEPYFHVIFFIFFQNFEAWNNLATAYIRANDKYVFEKHCSIFLQFLFENFY